MIHKRGHYWGLILMSSGGSHEPPVPVYYQGDSSEVLGWLKVTSTVLVLKVW